MKRAVWRSCAASVLSLLCFDAAAEPAGVSGPYLLARHAALSSDYGRAADHYAHVIARDPGNRTVMESAVSAYLNAGEAERAAEVARLLDRSGEVSQIATMALVVDHAAAGRWDAILRTQSDGREIGPLMDALAEGWALSGQGEAEAALSAFRALSESRGLAAFGHLHEALLRASLGDWAGAERIFAGRDATGQKVRDPVRLNRRTAILRASLLSQLNRNEHAVALIDHLFDGRPDPGVAALRARLAVGERIPYTGPLTAREGMAEAFYTVATALRGEAANGYVLLYGQAAAALAPEHGDAALLAGSLLRSLKRHEEAEAQFALVAPEHPAHARAQLSRASSLRAQGRGREAVSVLRDLADRHPEVPRIQTELGDVLRAQDRLTEAASAYDRALAVHDDPAEAPWSLHYARAMAREGLGDWTGARADLGRALEIEPDEPRVLHHLGSGMLKRGEPLGEALALIERAVEAAPEDGAMTGTLGWALYRMGRIEEAVEHLERAAVLSPLDVALNDHLGDAFWTAGRRREARFQWHRALGLGADREVAELIRRKLARGLEAGGPIALAAER